MNQEYTVDPSRLVSPDMTPADAEEMKVKDKQIVSVKIYSERSTVYGDVVVRVSEKFAPAMHIDTDESNAACAFGTVMGVVII